ncbi:MAG: hypothetical protein ACE5F9_01440 [Phycisphaerae bacterium]
MREAGDDDLRRLRISNEHRRCWPVLGVLVFFGGGVGCGSPWVLDPAFGQRYAVEQNKPLFLYFKAWDSTHHRNMKMKVLDSGPMRRELGDTVNVEVEFSFFPDVRSRYHVFRPQVCVMCKPDGKEVDRMLVNPVPSLKAFVAWFREAKAKAMPRSSTRPGTVEPSAPSVSRSSVSGGPT